MAGSRKKKYTSGEGSEYWTRNTALKKLQLSLKNFRRLCILKGIYPREPRNRKKAQHGDTSIKTLYAKKDIQFLLHEPIIWKLRELKTHTRKVNRAKTLHEFKEYARLRKTYPEITLDHIVKERYPTFLSALRDLDDCLTMCFLFSTFPQIKPLPRDQPDICRRLTFEFLHAVIVSQALRKVFVSIKGYYFQAEIKGQTITWIMPHNFGFEPQPKQEVDFNIMITFVQFYTVLLGFVNFRLYHSLNLYYPPKISSSDKRDNEIVDKQSYNNERVAALNMPLERSAGIPNNEDDDVDIDVFENAGDDEAIRKAKQEAENVKKLKTLFKGLKVFINREVPRLPLVFTLKCFGAEVSWDKTLFVGATFDESDETITHQIVDRPSVDKQYISRYYVQPQWVFDSVNARRLLPVEKYFIGVELPPHLSPFVDADEYGVENYVPPEQLILNKEENGEDTVTVEEIGLITPKRRKKKKDKKDSMADLDSDEDSKETEVTDATLSGKVKNGNNINDTEEDAQTSVEKKREKMKKKMLVKTGKVITPDPMELKKAEYQEFKLREKMVPKKYKKLYASMMRGKHNRKVDKVLLSRKRVKLERLKKRQSSTDAV